MSRASRDGRDGQRARFGPRPTRAGLGRFRAAALGETSFAGFPQTPILELLSPPPTTNDTTNDRRKPTGAWV